jgi:hypothetical protein
MIAKPTTNALPDNLKAMTREQFLANRKPNQILSSIDLHWILYWAALGSGTPDAFDSAIRSMLDGSLGQNNYGYALSMTVGGSGSEYEVAGRLSNCLLWCGDAGVLPAIGGTNYSVFVSVSQS